MFSSVEARAVELINEAIDSCDSEQLLKALQNPAAQLPPVFDYACALYFEEFHNMRDEKQSELDYDEISAAVRGEGQHKRCEMVEGTAMISPLVID